MFSYYGSKAKVVQYYPSPTTLKIREAFAGSARYSVMYWDTPDILLMDKYQVIVDVWHYLQRASVNDILGLPRLKEGETLDDFNLSYEEKMFLGFCIKGGNQIPSKKTTWRNVVHRPNSQNYRLQNISSNLYKIKHWKIIQGSYEDLPNENATWFIDPPYQFGGEHYKESNKNLDFNSLANWSKTRQGQVIVCENTKADWMDFKEINFFKHANNMGNEKTTEAIWTNFPTQYDSVQQELFSWAGGK